VSLSRELVAVIREPDAIYVTGDIPGKAASDV